MSAYGLAGRFLMSGLFSLRWMNGCELLDMFVSFMPSTTVSVCMADVIVTVRGKVNGNVSVGGMNEL